MLYIVIHYTIAIYEIYWADAISKPTFNIHGKIVVTENVYININMYFSSVSSLLSWKETFFEWNDYVVQWQFMLSSIGKI